jgi:hypothetical protein
MSDGQFLFASRLGDDTENEGPNWHLDGTLTMPVPAVAGRVVGLSTLDDKLLVHCERGLYYTGGEGPDDLGQGPSFIPLVRGCDIGTADQRSIVSTPKGVVFQTAFMRADGRRGTGGLWIFDRSLSCSAASLRVQDTAADSLLGELSYLPEREQLYWFRPNTTLLGFAQTNSQNILVWDFRTNSWANWQISSASSDKFGPTQCCAAGVLWSCGTEPMAFTGTAGQDFDTASRDFAMNVTIDVFDVAPDATSRWGKVRSISLVGDIGPQYTLTISAGLDDRTGLISDPIVLNDATTATWPTNRAFAEWRLPQQKCSTMRVTLSADKAVAIWNAIELDVYTNNLRAPSNKRA